MKLPLYILKKLFTFYGKCGIMYTFVYSQFGPIKGGICMNIQSGPFTVEFLGTPEAGRTSAIKRTRKKLSDISTVRVLQEAATVIPDIFETQEYKKSVESHFWMRLTMAAKLLEQQCVCNPTDILLVDRGLIDAFCWNYFFAEKGGIPNKVALHYKGLTESILNLPNLVVYLKTTPEEAIRRHGGEGEIVTSEFIQDFERSVTTFLRYSPVPVFTLDTTDLSKDKIADTIYAEIVSAYKKSMSKII